MVFLYNEIAWLFTAGQWVNVEVVTHSYHPTLQTIF
jgi:hypothetical protein